jgi:hypothetical protein
MVGAFWTNLADNRLRARLIATGNAGAIDPGTIAQLILSLISVLAKCQPTPQQGYDYLAWKPWKIFDVLGTRLKAYRKMIEGAIAATWKGTQAQLVAIVAGIWAAVDAGDLTPDLLAGLYQEAGLPTAND